VTAQRTKVDWARQFKDLVDVRYPDAERIVLVLDTLNTHTPASLYEAYPLAEAKRLADTLAIHDRPKHGSWLNIAEIELSVLARQCAVIWGHAAAQRSLHATVRSAPSGLTWVRAQRIPAPFRRAWTTSLLALSTLPRPRG
jgi:hypothetical protein